MGRWGERCASVVANVLAKSDNSEICAVAPDNDSKVGIQDSVVPLDEFPDSSSLFGAFWFVPTSWRSDGYEFTNIVYIYVDRRL